MPGKKKTVRFADDIKPSSIPQQTQLSPAELNKQAEIPPPANNLEESKATTQNFWQPASKRFKRLPATSNSLNIQIIDITKDPDSNEPISKNQIP